MNELPRFLVLNYEYPSRSSRASLWTSSRRSKRSNKIRSEIVIGKERFTGKTLIRRVVYLSRVLASSLVYLPEGTLADELDDVVVLNAHCWTEVAEREKKKKKKKKIDLKMSLNRERERFENVNVWERVSRAEKFEFLFPLHSFRYLLFIYLLIIKKI